MARRGMMVVMNDIVRDSRVLKMAAAMRKMFPDFVLVGRSAKAVLADSPLEEYHNGVRCLFFSKYDEIPKRKPDESDEKVRFRHHLTAMACFFRNVRSFAADFAPDVLHTHDMYLMGLGEAIRRDASNRPVYWIHDNHEWVAGSSHIPPAFRTLAGDIEAAFIHDADYHLTATEGLAGVLKEQYGSLPPMRTIFNAPALYPPLNDAVGTVKANLDIGAAPLIVYAGQTKAGRGVERVMPVLHHLPDTHFAIITNNKGDHVDAIQAAAEACGVKQRVHWLPYAPHDQVWRYLSDADLGVIPFERYGNTEYSLPTKLFEFVFAGLPVVAPPLKALSGFMKEYGAGKVVDFDDPAGAAKTIDALLSNRSAGARDQKVRREVIANFAWEVQERRLLEVYAKAAGAPPEKLIDPIIGAQMDANAEEIRVLHGPTPSAGQPAVLARALDRLPGVSARSLHVLPSKFGYAADLNYPVKSAADPVEMTGALRAVIDDFDIFHFHARSFMIDPTTGAFPAGFDLLLLKAAGKRIVMHFRGSEARLFRTFKAMTPFHYAESEIGELQSGGNDETKRRILDFASAIADEVVVVDPELQTYLPEARIVERAINLEKWPFIGLGDNPRPLVVHAPSRRGVKGSDAVLAAVERLQRNGVSFDFELVEGVPQNEARKIYQRADIIVDQLRIGWYGVLAVEAMALGKPVVSYVREDLIHHLGGELPIAVATPESVATVLQRLILDLNERARLSQAGRAYCEAHHDANVVAQKLHNLYQEVNSRPMSIDLDTPLDYIVRAIHHDRDNGVKMRSLERKVNVLRERNSILQRELKLAEETLSGSAAAAPAYSPFRSARLKRLAESARNDGPFAPFKLVVTKLASITKAATRKLVIKPASRFIISRCSQFLKYAAFSDAVAQDVAEWRPDVVHAHDLHTLPTGRATAKKTGAALIYDSHELETHRQPPPPPIRQKTIEWLEKRSIKDCDAVITVSDAIADHLQRKYNITRPAVVRNAPVIEGEGENETETGTDTLRIRLGLSRETKLIVYVGFVTLNRGIDMVLKALVSLPDVEFATVGPQREETVVSLRAEAEKLGVADRFHLVDPVPAATVVSFIKSADVGVIPILPVTLSYEYAMPNKLFEMAFAGLPIVASDLQEIRKFVERYDLGEIYPPYDANACSAAIKRLLDKGSAAKPSPKVLAQLTEEHAWRAQCRTIENVYQLVAKNRAAQA